MFSFLFLVLFLFIQPAKAATPMEMKRLIAVVQQTGLETNTIIGSHDLTTLFKASIYNAEAWKCGPETVITAAVLESRSSDAGLRIMISLHIATGIYPGRTLVMMDMNADGVVDGVAPNEDPLPKAAQDLFDRLVTCALTPQ